MINVLSPYNVTTSFVSVASGLTCTSYTLSLFIWDGAKASPPGTATYTITKQNPTGSTGDDDIDIAPYVQDYIDFTPKEDTSTLVIDGDNQYWIKTSATYITTDPNDATTPQYASTLLAGLGYNYGFQAPLLSADPKSLLIDEDGFKVNRAGYFCVPVLIDESTSTPATVISSPGFEINESYTLAATTDSGELVKYIWVDLSETTSDTSVVITFDTTNTVTLLIQDECRYTPVDFAFINKDGGQQLITFFKEQREKIAITDNEYESNGVVSDGVHQFKRLNVQARTSITYNSGFVHEDMNETFKQFLLSERVWKLESSNYIPVNVVTKGVEYKTRQNDRLVNYAIEITNSYNEIQNI